MAFQKPISQLLIFFLLSTSLLQDQEAEARVTHHFQSAQAQEVQPQSLSKEGLHQRRQMIGSRAPTCTYNECRRCRFKCSGEQVPVDTGDPMNSAYHYRCVCHR